ncbi:MAG: putative metal-binding motif-containing protein, partial [Deltaproteobacteria bacterium]|nr:putative metal-binding motif-containing protein [Deltaproteobacteria bacterium]
MSARSAPHFAGAEPRADQAGSTLRRAWLTLVAALALTGCYTTEFNPTTPSGTVDIAGDAGDSTGVDSAVDGVVDVVPDGQVDTTVTELPDTASEVVETDVADTADTAEDSSDVADVPLVDTTPDADTAAQDADAGPALLPLGHTCTADEQCETAICLTVTGSPKICSKPCTGECAAGLRCGLDLATGSTSVPYCLPLPNDLCKPCELDTDCSGGACVPLTASKESLCGVACGPGGTCPTGFVCQSFLSGEVCVPQLGTCTCSAPLVDQAWACEVSNSKVGKCLGVQTCTESGWSLCSAAMPIPELCDGQDNNCNGLTDESYTALGTSCGIGQCAGGKFICSADKKSVVCSSEAKKPAKDLCNNGLDDNCDGKTDEGCPPKDTDNDGSPDLQDCAPYLAEIHPGAIEGCCLALPPAVTPAAVDVATKTKACDANCDGKVTPCSTLDTDGDGFLPPEDCNNQAPKSHPGAPDKCGDGIDQDCDGTDAVCDLGNDQDGDGWPAPLDCDDSTNKIFPGAKEACNGYDEDCDGVVDNGNPSGGTACGASMGACKAGTMVCTVVGLAKSATMLCVDAQGGEPETCNGKDDNCDGLTDETFLDQGLGAKCDTDDSDMCSNGVKVCQADGISLTCAVESVHDLVESCKSPGVGNGQDEDCDGQTDEACYPADLDGDGAVGSADCNEYDAGYSPKIKVEPCCDGLSGKTPQQQKLCDKNCDGQVVWCDDADLDHDGYIEPEDCNPQDPTSYPGAPEACGDGIDQDCENGDLDCAGINDDDGDKYPNQSD